MADFDSMLEIDRSINHQLPLQTALRPALVELARLASDYDTLALDISRSSIERRALDLGPLAAAFAELPAQLRTVERYNALTVGVQSEHDRAPLYAAWSAAFAKLPEEERTGERYDIFAREIAGLRSSQIRETLGQPAQAQAFCALPPNERTLQRYKAFADVARSTVYYFERAFPLASALKALMKLPLNASIAAPASR